MSCMRRDEAKLSRCNCLAYLWDPIPPIHYVLFTTPHSLLCPRTFTLFLNEIAGIYWISVKLACLPCLSCEYLLQSHPILASAELPTLLVWDERTDIVTLVVWNCLPHRHKRTVNDRRTIKRARVWELGNTPKSSFIFKPQGNGLSWYSLVWEDSFSWFKCSSTKKPYFESMLPNWPILLALPNWTLGLIAVATRTSS